MTAKVAEMSWRSFEERLAQTGLVLIPVGAVEVYGPHMPQGTDGIVAEAVCERIAALRDCLIAPRVPVGWSESLASFPGTLSVRQETIKTYCGEIAQSLAGWGAQRILFVNGHAGNVPGLQKVCMEIEREHPGVRAAQVDIWRYIQPFTADLLESRAWHYGHAGEVMTSVMLHLHPEWVDRERIARYLPDVPAPLGLFTFTEYRRKAPDGLLGDATLATADKGAEIVRRLVEHLVAFIDGSFR